MKKKQIFVWLLLCLGSGAMAQNTATGTNAGNAGSNNSSFGYFAGDLVTGTDNVFVGLYSGKVTTSAGYNTFVGSYSGYVHTTGNSNTFLGYATGGANTTGYSNTFVGRSSGNANTTGYGNSYFGVTSGRFSTGNNNTGIGMESLFYTSSGGNNVALGYQAGYNATTASNNVFLGYQAGYNETASNRLYIDNSSTTSPLIFGDFSNDLLGVNGKLGVGTMSPGETFDVIGTARFQSLTQDNALTRVMVTNSSGKVFWRDASTLAVGGDNLGNHTPTQHIIPATDNAYDLGSMTNDFRDIYFTGKWYIQANQYLKVTTPGTAPSMFFGHTSGTVNTGNHNISMGTYTLALNTTGNGNTAMGARSLEHNTTADNNTATGFYALHQNTTGANNTAVGKSALENTFGSNNVGVGVSALINNIFGSTNTAIGYQAGPNNSNYSNTTAVGNGAVTTASNQVRIGDANVTSIGGQVGWTTLSDGRFKKNVKQDVAGLDFILKLNPVSYVVDRNAVDNFLGIPLDQRAKERPEVKRQTGFIAQEVETAVKKSNYAFYGVDAPKSDHDHYGIRYSEFVVPLTKAVQELNAKIEQQQKLIDKQQEMLVTLLARETSKATELKTGAVLYQNHPNPATNGGTQITMDIPADVREATVNVYDINGKTLDRVTVPGRGKGISVSAGGGKLTPGIYMYSLVIDGSIVSVNKMVMAD